MAKQPITQQIASTRRLRRRLQIAVAQLERHGSRHAARLAADVVALDHVLRSLQFLERHRPSFARAQQAANHPATRAVLHALPDAEIHSIRFTSEANP
jgi:hypothetical protein